MNDTDERLTARQVADLCQVHPESVYRWMRDGKIDFVELPSGRRQIRRSVVDAFLARESA